MPTTTDPGSAGCGFASTALGSHQVRVVSVNGVERLGQLYEFTVRFARNTTPLTEDELDRLLLAPCCLTLGNAAPINGIAREVRVHEAIEGRPFVYELILVPTVWLMTVSQLSRLYLKKSIKDMAAQVLGLYGLTAHCDLRIASPSAARDFCIQYQESDWDYLQRWFEYDGLFYWFEHSCDGEKLVVADTNATATPIPGDKSIRYADLGGVQRTQESVFSWRSVQRRIPASVILKDYNEQKPLLPMVGKADVDRKRGFGVFFEYGDNFETPEVGLTLAKVRADRFKTERLTLHGITDSVRFHVGHTFTLIDHFDDAQNREYLITAIEHRLGPMKDEGTGREILGYRARFEAIPNSVQFRPERVTPWPSIHGLMHGHIDSDRDGKYSTLDAQGRYIVRFPFDTTGATGDACSTWVRLSQSYAGSGYGSHFPLHKGTEVLLAFYDGDPDRPIIVGTVPNAVTPGPSVAANATQSGHKTASGLQFVLDDSVTG